MSILIKGMEMPECCSKCDLRVIAIGLDFQCAISGETVDDYYSSRHPKCPIVKVPTPHGRLIDADKAAHSILMMSSHPCGCSIENVKDVVEWLKFINGDGNNFAFPTIIEAEVNGE